MSFRRKQCFSAFFIVYGNSNVQNLLEIHCERSIFCRNEIQCRFRTFYLIESGKYVAFAWCCRYSHFVTFDYLTFGTYCDCSRSLDSYIRRNVQNSLEYGCKRSVFCCRELQGRFIAFNVFVADKYITFACYGSYSHFVSFEYLTFGSYRNCSCIFNVGNSRYVQNLLEYGGERSIVRYHKCQCRFCCFNVFETDELVTFVSSDGYRCILSVVVCSGTLCRAVFAHNHAYRVLDWFEVGNKSNIVGCIECIFWIVRNFVVANCPVNEVVTFVHCSRYRHFIAFEYLTFGTNRNYSRIFDVGNSRYVHNLLEYGGERGIVRYRKFQCRFCGFNVFETDELVTFVSSDGYRCILSVVVCSGTLCRAVFAHNHAYRVLDWFEVGLDVCIMCYRECVFHIG